MKVTRRDEVVAPDANLESPINVGVLRELREYQRRLGFSNVTDSFELINSRPLFSTQRSVKEDHTLHGAHAEYVRYIDHALHSDAV